MWFEELTDFIEQNASQVHQQIAVQGDKLLFKNSGKVVQAGTLSTPSLAELNEQAQLVLHTDAAVTGVLSLEEVVADVQELHANPDNAGALFQVASQFNLLEMVSPDVTPEQGVTRYQNDKTQGPACAIACGAGLIYRNYFVPVGEQLGQTANKQLNMLASLEQALVRYFSQLAATDYANITSPWVMQNGYALPSKQQLILINKVLAGLNPTEYQQLKELVCIGLQYDTQVTIKQVSHLVTQAYCSAMPVAYNYHSNELWQPLASLILDAAYEATFAAAVVNAKRTGNKRLYLTLLGGGAFGNSPQWILNAIKQACTRYKDYALEVKIVSYRYPNPQLAPLLSSLT